MLLKQSAAIPRRWSCGHRSGCMSPRNETIIWQKCLEWSNIVSGVTQKAVSHIWHKEGCSCWLSCQVAKQQNGSFPRLYSDPHRKWMRESKNGFMMSYFICTGGWLCVCTSWRPIKGMEFIASAHSISSSSPHIKPYWCTAPSSFKQKPKHQKPSSDPKTVLWQFCKEMFSSRCEVNGFGLLCICTSHFHVCNRQQFQWLFNRNNSDVVCGKPLIASNWAALNFCLYSTFPIANIWNVVLCHYHTQFLGKLVKTSPGQKALSGLVLFLTFKWSWWLPHAPVMPSQGCCCRKQEARNSAGCSGED